MIDQTQELETYLGEGKVRKDINIAPYTTFKVGGIVDYYVEAETDNDILNAIQAAYQLDMPLHIFGGISNVVIGKDGIRGLVVKNLVSYKNIVEETDEHVILRVSSGYNMTRLSKETAQDGYQGLEYHLGLPGTVGGAIYMNSGWYAHPPSKYVGDPVNRVSLASADGIVREVDKDYFKFDYDYSILQETHEIVIWVEFKLIKSDPDTLVARGKEALEYRKKTQPFGIPTSGCFFRNVNGESVGKIIDEIGLKGYTIGGAQVSTLHANFIINTGNATAEDVQKLVQHIKDTVRDKRGIELEEEVICI